ncbi:MAG: tripartite tricarboxylate transporter permease, partial [Candidatus Micrarchaeota archaeon]|nr:tripartite tricarboxylate transporter permease [Candidatus Micrarchaeota archaeon]
MDFASIVAGILLGIFAGLIPGIHTNTIAGVLSNIRMAPEALAGAIAAAAAAQVVFQFIPAIFLFIPDAETVVSVLPGQRMLMKGKGFAALYVCAVSCVFATWLALILLPVAAWLMPLLYGIIGGAMFPVLAILSLFLLAGEGSIAGFAKASLVFALSGLLGVLVLWLPLMPDPLLPSFSGMFALAAVAVSLGGKIKIPKQELDFGTGEGEATGGVAGAGTWAS